MRNTVSAVVLNLLIAEHPEPEVARRNRESHEVFGKTLIALDSGSH